MKDRVIGPAEFGGFLSNQGGILHAHGGIAQRLLVNRFDPGSLRPFEYNGKSWTTVKVNGKVQTIHANTTATLRYDEWKAIDTAVVKIAQQRLVAAADLQNRGLTYPLSNGLGTTVLQWETQSDYTAAEIDMEAQKQSEEDRVLFETNYIPIPIIHKSFSISARALEASRRNGEPLDTTNAELAARKVAEKVEDVILLGSSTFAFGGGTLYGYKDYVHRNTVTLVSNWDASATSGQDILDDVLAMIDAAHDDRHYGPFVLYVPTAYDVILDDDYKAASDKTIRQRILELNAISDIRCADRLTANNVLLVEMQPETVKLIVGMPITTLQWEEQGGLLLKFKIMCIMVPWIRCDQENRCGIVHLRA